MYGKWCLLTYVFRLEMCYYKDLSHIAAFLLIIRTVYKIKTKPGKNKTISRFQKIVLIKCLNKLITIESLFNFLFQPQIFRLLATYSK